MRNVVTLFALLVLFFACNAYGQGTVTGTAFVDNNNNGIYDTGDTPITTFISLVNSSTNINYSSTFAIGAYSFSGVPYGSYYVEFTSTASNTPPFGACAKYMATTIQNPTYTNALNVIKTPVFTLSATSPSLTYNALYISIISLPGYPSIQSSAFNANVGSTSVALTWTRGNGSGVAVLANSKGVTTPSLDCQTLFGNSTYSGISNVSTGDQVVYDGTGTSVTVTGLTPGTTYYFSIYEYSNFGPGYLTPPARLTITTASITYPYAGSALQFDGVTNYADEIGDCANNSDRLEFIQNTGVFTIEGWIKLQSAATDGAFTIISNTSSASDNGFYFGFDNRSALGRSQQLLLGLYNSSGTPVIESVSSANVITDTEWHHVAASSNGSGVTFYVDGWSYTGTGTIGALATGGATRQPEIGASPTGTTGVCINYTGNQYYFQGLMDELRIWSTARTMDQIRIYKHLTLLGNETGLYSYWQFENEGTTILSEPISLKTAVNGGIANTPATFVISEAPVARGQTLSYAAGTTSIFSAYDKKTIALAWPIGSTLPNGLLYISWLNANPVTLPSGVSIPDTGYYIINNYGTNATFTALSYLYLEGLTISTTEVSTPSDLILFKRPSNASGNTWVNFGGATTALQASGTAEFGTVNNITSFSQVIVGHSSSPLPVQLISFNAFAQGDNIDLNWVTAEEINNKGFVVQMKTEADSLFTNKCFVAGSNGTEVTTYTYTIPDQQPGNYLLRLKQEDINGDSTYSSIVSVVIASPAVAVSNPSPNPFSSEAVFTITAKSEYIAVSVYDVMGRLLKTIFNGTIKGQKELSINASDFPSGLLFIKITTEETELNKTVSLVK